MIRAILRRRGGWLTAMLVLGCLWGADTASALGKKGKYSEVHGTVTAVDATMSTLTIQKKDGTSVTVPVDAAATIIHNAAAATLSEILVNDKAVVIIATSTGNAVKIISVTLKPKPIIAEGTVTAVDTTGSTVDILKKDGTTVTAPITATTKIVRNFASATLADIQVNDKALAVLDGTTGNAISLLAKSPDFGKLKVIAVGGTVTAVDLNALTLAIQKKNGTSTTVTLTAQTKITRNGAAAALSSIALGDFAAAYVDTTTGNVTKLCAKGP